MKEESLTKGEIIEAIEKLVEKQHLLRAMKESCVKSEQELNQEISKFLSEHLKYGEKAHFSMVEVIERALKA